MLWWFVAIVGGWIASGALIPMLWEVSKLTSNEGPTSKEAIGRGIAGPIMGAAGNLPLAVVRVGLERRRPHANLLIDLPRAEGGQRTGDDAALKGDASLFVCNVTVAPVSVSMLRVRRPEPGCRLRDQACHQIQVTPLQAECLGHALHDRC
jgi:hypothetical protein